MKERLRELFDYKDGVLRWKLTGVRGFSKTGQPAGSPNKGYLWVVTKHITGTRGVYGVNRLVWVWHNGPIPEGMWVDHIDRNRTNNRIENLRLASPSENAMNAKGKSSKQSGLPLNVYVDFTYKDVSKYRAQVVVDGVPHRVGLLDTPEEAALEAARLRTNHHKEFCCHG